MKIRFPRVLFLIGLILLVPAVFAQGLPDFTVLVENNAPAIVNVSASRNIAPVNDEQRAYLDELRRYFYGDSAPEIDLPPMQGATGSGFIISADGYIVTNHHVIEDADSITITLNDQREFEASIIGSDQSSDLALLKIDTTDLPMVMLGNSAGLKVGEWVLAIGSPFGLQYSVAAGIISYMGRSLPTGGSNYVSYIQTDVAINPGHSGGPLFNLKGEVIGINSQIFTNSGGSIGLSFAIPVDVAKNVVGQLKDHGKVNRGWLGVGIEDVSQSKAEAFNLLTPHGALVNNVIDDSPAQHAGLQAGDIIVALENQLIRTSADLPYFVGLVMPDTEVNLDVVRNGQTLKLPVTVGVLASSTVARNEEIPGPAKLILGLVVQPLDEGEKTELGLESGVLVASATGVASLANIEPGDIIISLNGEAIDSAEQLDEVASALPLGKALPVLVSRKGRQNFFTLRIEEKD